MDFFRVLSRKKSCDVSRIYYLLHKQNIAGNGNTYAMLL